MYEYIVHHHNFLKQYSAYLQAQCRFLYIIQVLINKTNDIVRSSSWAQVDQVREQGQVQQLQAAVPDSEDD